MREELLHDLSRSGFWDWYKVTFSGALRVIGDIQRRGSLARSGQDLGELKLNFKKTDHERFLQVRAIARVYTFLSPTFDMFQRWKEAEKLLAQDKMQGGLTPGSIFLLLSPRTADDDCLTIKIPISIFIEIMDYSPLFSRYAQIGVFEAEVLFTLMEKPLGPQDDPWGHFVQKIFSAVGRVPLAFWLSATTQQVSNLIPHIYRDRFKTTEEAPAKNSSTRYSALKKSTLENISTFSQIYGKLWNDSSRVALWNDNVTSNSWQRSGLSHFVFSASAASLANKRILENRLVLQTLRCLVPHETITELQSRCPIAGQFIRSNEFFMTEDGQPFENDFISQLAASSLGQLSAHETHLLLTASRRLFQPRPSIEPLSWIFHNTVAITRAMAKPGAFSDDSIGGNPMKFNL